LVASLRFAIGLPAQLEATPKGKQVHIPVPERASMKKEVATQFQLADVGERPGKELSFLVNSAVA
jgi:hypothetical protein